MAAKRAMSVKWIRGLVVGGAAAVLGVVLVLFGVFESLELRTWDWRVSSLVRETDATDDVVLILVSEADLDNVVGTFGVDFSWPWPRSIYGYFVDYLTAGGAKAVAFDLIFKDPGRSFEDDMEFAYAMEATENVVIAVTVGDEAGEETGWSTEAVAPPLRVDVTTTPEATLEALSYPRVDYPLSEYAEMAAALGNVRGTGDPDGVFRRGEILVFLDGTPVPSLALATLAVGKDGTVDVSLEPGAAVVDGKRIPMDSEGRAILRYSTPEGIHTSYTAYDILYSAFQLLILGEEPDIDPAEFDGKYVLFGLEATGLLDLRPTPLDEKAPGVTVHATMLDNLLSGEFMRELPLWADIALVIVMVLAAALVASLVEKTIVAVVIFVVFLGIPVGLAFGGYAIGLWVPLVGPLIAVVVALAAANVANFATEGAQRRQIRGMFGRYLSPAVISQLEANPENLELGGEEREISIFFSDIQKFSTISKDLVVRYGSDGAKQLTSFINDYLTPMTDIILEEGGTIDKYEGDAIIAFWGAPVDQPDHAQRAVRSVMRCQAALDELRPHFLERVGKEVYQRIGINTGIATVGNMGSQQRFDYTMIGDSVNLAARLEGANKAFGTYTMVAEDTIKQIGDLYPTREMGNIGVVGREDEPVRIFEPMSSGEYEKRAGALQLFGQALQLFYQGKFAEAKTIFARIADADPVAASYLPRCDTLIAEPPANWTGVWVLTEKG